MTGIAPPHTIYADPFLNALTASHVIVVKAEVWRGTTKLMDLPILSGSVTADRHANVQRTLHIDTDPDLTPQDATDPLSPYGNYLKVWRGVRYPDGRQELAAVFYGRIEVVDGSAGNALSLRCLDRSADILDARFLTPRMGTKDALVTDQIKSLIQEVLPGVVVNIQVTASNKVGVVTWDRERGDALADLATSISAEWFAGPNGQFYVSPIPSVNDATPVKWVADAGAYGVTVARSSSMDRAGVFNAVVAIGETSDGKPPLIGYAYDLNENSPTYWEGSFGKVPRFFASQFMTTQQHVDNAAKSILLDELSPTRSITISCVPNPKLNLSDLIRVHGFGDGIDGMYLVHSFSLPLDPDSAMTIQAEAALDETMTLVRSRDPEGFQRWR